MILSSINILFVLISISLRLIAIIETFFVLSQYGINKEINPVSKYIFKHFGIGFGLILLFVISVPFVFWAIDNYILMFICILIFSLDAINDTIVYRKLLNNQ